MHSLQGSVAIVTGAASGIGLAISGRLASAGARLVMTDLDDDAVHGAAAAVSALGAEVRAMQLDVRDAVAVDLAGRQAVEHFGGLHIAINNAGVVNRGNSWELALDEWHRVIDVNLWGVVHGVRAFVPRILESGGEGHVVNIASMAAVLPQERLGPYTVAKHGVLGLSDVLRAELEALGAPVGVSVVFPGRIRTAMNSMGSVEPDTVAANVLGAIAANRPYVFTDDHATEAVESRLHAILSARQHVRGD